MIFLAKRIGDVTFEDIAEALPMFMLIMAAIFVICIIIIKKKDSENDELPIKGANATIVDMQRVDSNTIAIVTWTMFETSDGIRVRLSTRANNTYVIGDKGYLRWQGTRLISFERGKTAPNHAGLQTSYSAAPQPQGKIPAWMQVEMEKEQQKKAQAAAPESVAACPNCGAPRKGKGAFCGRCGTKF